MVLRSVFVVARTHAGRPTLQHRLVDEQTHYTLCGVDVSPWSRHYMSTQIREIICLRCVKAQASA